MPNEPVCIRRANTMEEAEIIVAWLDEQGVKATVVDPNNPGVMAFGSSDAEGITIYVADAETADRAEALLAEHDKQHVQGSATAPAGDAVDVTCTVCGRVNSFSPDTCGSVQECAECSTYLDVPAADQE